MGMFDHKSNDEKAAEIFEKFGLNLDKYNVDDIKRENVKNLQQVVRDIAGKNWMKAGMALSLASADKQATVGYLSAIFNQNWILIRQNELIIRLLEQFSKK